MIDYNKDFINLVTDNDETSLSESICSSPSIKN